MQTVRDSAARAANSIGVACPGFSTLAERFMIECRKGELARAEATWDEATRLVKAFNAGGSYALADLKLRLTEALGEPVILKSTLQRIARDMGIADA